MGKLGKIAPIQKTYGDAINTIDQQLSKHGYVRAPGTFETFLPYKEASGKYRTGLDTEASYLNTLSREDKEAEVVRIIADKERLEKALGVPNILDSTSIFYNFAVDKDRLIKEFGGELQISPIKVGNDVVVFNLDNIIQEIAWNWIKVHPRVAPSRDAFDNGRVGSEVKYYLVDDDVETKQIYNKKREINKAIVAFENLTPTKKRQIGRLMNLPITEGTTEETIYNLIDNQLKEVEFKTGVNKGYSPVRIFTELLKMKDDRLKIKDLITQAIAHSVYREGIGGKITEGTYTISASREELTEFLLDDKNQMDLLALEKKLKMKLTEKS